MHFFIDHTKLPIQSSLDKYGPVDGEETTKYKVTSKFQLLEVAKAFACYPGQMVVQQSIEDASLVNVILEPTNSPEVPFGKVKYMIYRGILKETLINGIDLIAKGTPDENELVTRIYNAVPTIESYTAVILGFDNNTLSGTDNVDTLFYKGNGNIKPVKVLEGEWFGNFTTTHEIGFEIILETDKIDVNLDFVRAKETVVDVTGLTNFDERIEREQIISFADPAAFWGIHYYEGIKISLYNNGQKTVTKKKEQEIYSLLISPYATRNSIYLDIRSEYGYSYNLYQNYGDENGYSIKLGNSDLTPVPVDYAKNGWPILFIEAPVTTGTDRNNIKINLRIDDNVKPLLFVEDLTVMESTDDSYFVDGIKLLANENDTDWTRPITLTIPNTGTDTQKDNVASYIRLSYFRQVNNPNSPDTVLQRLEDGDNIFCPLNTRGLGGDDLPFEQTEGQQPVFVNGTLDPEPVYPGSIDDILPPSNDFSYFAKSGAYFNSQAVTFYTNFHLPKKQSRNPLSPPPLKNFGLNMAGKFANQAYLAKDTLVDATSIEEELPEGGTQKVDILSIRAAENFARQKENINFLGITKAELQALKTTPGLSDKHSKFITFVKEQPSYVDLNGIVYKKATLAVQGIDNNGHQKVVIPENNIYVFFKEIGQGVSDKYSTALEYLEEEPIIDNGIQYTDLGLAGEGYENYRVIGYCQDRGNTEDMTYGYNGNITGVREDVLSQNNKTLFTLMKVLFIGTTISDLTGLGFVAKDFIDKFSMNGSIIIPYEHPTLNQKVAVRTRYINFIKSFGKDLEERLSFAQGDISLVQKIEYFKGDNQKHPVFNTLFDRINGLQILINDTEFTMIYEEPNSYIYNPQTKDWSINVIIKIIDHFGLDFNDVIRYQFEDFGAGFAGWYILQHKRNYVPFLTRIVTRCTLSGRL